MNSVHSHVFFDCVLFVPLNRFNTHHHNTAVVAVIVIHQKYERAIVKEYHHHWWTKELTDTHSSTLSNKTRCRQRREEQAKHNIFSGSRLLQFFSVYIKRRKRVIWSWLQTKTHACSFSQVGKSFPIIVRLKGARRGNVKMWKGHFTHTLPTRRIVRQS